MILQETENTPCQYFTEKCSHVHQLNCNSATCSCLPNDSVSGEKLALGTMALLQACSRSWQTTAHRLCRSDKQETSSTMAYDEYPQKFVLDSGSENKPRRCMLRYLRSPRINLQQYHVSVFFQFFTMSKMVISSMYIFWKNSLLPRLHKKIDFVYYNNIILYIYDNTHILPIPPNTYEYHQYHTKKTSGTELISTLGSLHIGLFSITYESFSTDDTRWYCVP
jgi:hypothetical protein